MTKALTEVEGHVRKGARWLDKNDPAWFTYINVDELAMENECKCVLGQLAKVEPNPLGAGDASRLTFWAFIADRGSWHYLHESDFTYAAPFNCTVAEAIDMGFDAGAVDAPDEFLQLERAWKKEIAKREKKLAWAEKVERSVAARG